MVYSGRTWNFWRNDNLDDIFKYPGEFGLEIGKANKTFKRFSF